jgi:hypothetical protein
MTKIAMKKTEEGDIDGGSVYLVRLCHSLGAMEVIKLQSRPVVCLVLSGFRHPSQSLVYRVHLPTYVHTLLRRILRCAQFSLQWASRTIVVANKLYPVSAHLY